MSRISYSYAVVQYLHDAAVGERLNVGVVMVAPAARWFGFTFDEHYKRLSTTFRDFDGARYKGTVERFNRALYDIKHSLEGLPLVQGGAFVDVADLMRHAWPDQGLSFRIGETFAGVTDNLESTLAHLFERMVTSQYPGSEEARRNKEQVWQVFRKPLEEVRATRPLREKSFKSSDFELTFKHAYQNHKWHVLEPISFDYKNKDNIQRVAMQWLGHGVALKEQADLGTLYLLLGAPEARHRAAYHKAKDLLHKIELQKELIEENEAKDFARHLAKSMREQGVEGMDDGDGQ
jgi:hypothetical protein